MILLSLIVWLRIFADDFESLRILAKADYDKINSEMLSISSCLKRDEMVESFFKRYGEENIYAMNLSYFAIKRCIRNSKMGFCCDDGSVVIDPVYDYVTSFYEGYARIKVADKWGIINRKGEVVLEPKYDRQYVKDRIEALRENYVEKRLIYTYQVKLQKFIFEDGEMIKYVVGDRVGFTDKDGNVIIPIKYENAFGFTQGLSAVKLGGRWGFIDPKDNVVIPFRYQDAYPFFEDRAAVKLNGKWGFIDITGKMVIENKYDFVFSFNEMRALVVKDGKYGFVDYEGREVIKPIYDDATDFSSGIAVVKKDGKNYYIDRWGNLLEKNSK